MLPHIKRAKPIEKRHVHALTICINYSDYLLNVANFNLKVLDDWTIVTLESDEKTISFCRSKGIKTLFVDKIEVNGYKFNRSYILNYALNHIQFNDWVLFLDADTLIPGVFNEFKFKQWDKSAIYGSQRHIIKNSTELASVKHNPGVYTANKRRFQVTGFFMLCHSSSPHFINGRFDDVKHGVYREDTVYAEQWKTWLRAPFDVYHLGDFGKNWHGRVTPEFK